MAIFSISLPPHTPSVLPPSPPHQPPPHPKRRKRGRRLKNKNKNKKKKKKRKETTTTTATSTKNKKQTIKIRESANRRKLVMTRPAHYISCGKRQNPLAADASPPPPPQPPPLSHASRGAPPPPRRQPVKTTGSDLLSLVRYVRNTASAYDISGSYRNAHYHELDLSDVDSL